MTTPIEKARDEGNRAGAIRGGEEACEEVRKRRVCCCLLVSSGSLSPPGPLHVKSARLRTETSYKAGSGGRVSTTSRSRSQLSDQVKGELVQRKFMSLSGETNPEFQSGQEGPNNEEQGGATGELATREPPRASGSVSFRLRRLADHRFIIPTGTYRRGAHRTASLERL